MSAIGLTILIAAVAVVARLLLNRRRPANAASAGMRPRLTPIAVQLAGVTLDRDDTDWKGCITLPSWQGFQARDGSYGSPSGGQSDGAVQVIVPVADESPDQPTEHQKEALEWLLKNEASVTHALLAHLLKDYPEIRDVWDPPMPDELDRSPDITDVEGFKPIIGLHTVYLHGSKDGIPYLGFELGCAWDEEHGAGFLMHGQRVLESGGAETAFGIRPEDAESET